ncbi:hypothetical protein [Streptomyces sp. NPDC001914]|uniref:hypothetical protein n=1 Tax=Streptomyces sp. NPDC001914 TaxID=3364623 RepID=UPI0036B2CB54
MNESIVALAAAGGAAVVQAAGTDAWTATRERIRQVFSRHHDRGHQAALLLDRMESELTADPSSAAQDLLRNQWRGVWHGYLESWLQQLPHTEREVLVDELRSASAPSEAAHRTVDVQVGRDVTVRAESGSVASASLRVEGGIHLSAPFTGPPQPGR